MWIALHVSDVDAVAADRFERIEIHDVFPRLTVDPVDRGFGCQYCELLTEPPRSGMEAHRWQVGPQSEKDNSRFVLAESSGRVSVHV